MIKRLARFQINTERMCEDTAPRIVHCTLRPRTYTPSSLPPIFPESEIFRSKRHVFLAV